MALVELMRRVVEGEAAPADAVRDYHDRLRRQGLAPDRALDDDLAVTDPWLRAEA